MRPGEGEVLTGEDRELRVKVVRPELDLLEYEVSRGYEGPGPHFHKRHVDSFYVLAGELEFLLGEEKVRAATGSFVLAPPEFVHTFWNPGPAPARYLNFHTPGAQFEQYLVEPRREGESQTEFYERFDTFIVDRPHPADI